MNYLIPSVLALATLGAFGLTGNLAGPITVLVFAIVGWFFRRYDYSVPGAVIGMLLGRMAESSLLHTYQISGGQLSYIFERPIAFGILILMLVSLFSPILIKKFKEYRAKSDGLKA
jgi:putative tricarboxylic transport membrane protein